MKVQTTIRSTAVVLLLAAAVSPLGAQTPGQKANAPAQDRPVKQQQGLIDFALHGINPNDKDYGTYLEEARRVVIEETVDRIYFWSDLLAIGIAICLLLVVVHQHRLLQRREGMAAEALTQYRNALARAEAQAEEAGRKNHDLMQALSASHASGATPNTVETGDHAERGKQRKAAAALSAVPASVATAPLAAATSVAATTKDSAVHTMAQESQPRSQMGLFGPDGDFVAKINSLQQQLNTAQERERQLRRQLNDSELRFEKERQKSRGLQG